MRGGGAGVCNDRAEWSGPHREGLRFYVGVASGSEGGAQAWSQPTPLAQLLPMPWGTSSSAS